MPTSVSILLRGGPADGQAITVEEPAPKFVDIEFVRRVFFRLTEWQGEGDPRDVPAINETATRHRYQLVDESPLVMEWLHEVQA